MNSCEVIRGIKLHTALEHWPLKVPFQIGWRLMENLDVLVVRLEKEGTVGQGEAAGVPYKKDLPASMAEQIEAVREALEREVSRDSLAHLLPPGGARNAVDCALWDLEAKLTGRPVWSLAGLPYPMPVVTTFTCGAESPEGVANTALSYAGARAIQLKLTGEAIDIERIRAVRRRLPDIWLGVDANQAFTRKSLQELLPTLEEMRVALIEQPFPVGRDEWLDGLASPIPIAADESAQTSKDIPRLMGRYNTVNIKLDKCGGLTEGLAMARAAHKKGLNIMVGNMLGTSLAMAPAWLIGQLCRVIDLDGPLFLKADRTVTVRYTDGLISCPAELWGAEVRSE